MQVGTVKEIKAHEYRVGLTPSCARAYTARGHKVVVESGAGSNAGFSDAKYAAAGAVIEKAQSTSNYPINPSMKQ